MGNLIDYRARFYSTYLTQFSQPDTIIPNPSNPQAWNRYSYVGNRPVNFNDPTGYFACGDGETKVCDTGKKQDPSKDPHPNWSPTKKGTGGDIDHEERHHGKLHSIVDPPKNLEPDTFLREQEIQPDYTDPELEGIGYWAEYGKVAWEAFIHTENYGVPVYKQLRSYANSTPIVEAIIGAMLQVSHDINNPNLSLIVKVRNAGVVGLEYGLTDMASAPLAGFLAGVGESAGSVGVAAGYVAGNLTVTAAMNAAFWDSLNEDLGISQ